MRSIAQAKFRPPGSILHAHLIGEVIRYSATTATLQRVPLQRLAESIFDHSPSTLHLPEQSQRRLLVPGVDVKLNAKAGPISGRQKFTE